MCLDWCFNDVDQRVSHQWDGCPCSCFCAWLRLPLPVTLRHRRSWLPLSERWTSWRRADATAAPPFRDISLSIATAEHLFLEGAYRRARGVLERSIGRNKRHAARMPIAVAALYEAQATLGLHDGILEIYRSAETHRVRGLRDNLPADDEWALAANGRLGDIWSLVGKPRQAAISYRAAADEARSVGRPIVAALINLRRAALELSRDDPRDDPLGAAGILSSLAPSVLAQNEAVQLLTAVLGLRVAARLRDEDGIERALHTLEALPSTGDPVLLSEDPLVTSDDVMFGPPGDRRVMPPGGEPLETKKVYWVDVGFTIAPAGRAGEVEVLRGSLPSQELAALRRQIASRRYGAFTAPEGWPGAYRVERWSLGSLRAPKRTCRVGSPEFQRLDLTRGGQSDASEAE